MFVVGGTWGEKSAGLLRVCEIVALALIAGDKGTEGGLCLPFAHPHLFFAPALERNQIHCYDLDHAASAPVQKQQDAHWCRLCYLSRL